MDLEPGQKLFCKKFSNGGKSQKKKCLVGNFPPKKIKENS